MIKEYLQEMELRFPNGVIQMSDTLCSYDPQLGAMIHRFDIGSYTCRCGEDVVEEKKDEDRPKGWMSFGRRKKARN